MIADLKEKIADADLVLIGIGEEFEIKKQDIENNREYSEILNEYKNDVQLLPYIEKDFIVNSNDKAILRRKQSYRQLFELIRDKNYFIVSLCTDGIIHEAGIEEQRIVEPCGTLKMMQCCDKCTGDLYEADDLVFNKIEKSMKEGIKINTGELPACPKCGKMLVFNTINAENYAEEGYLEKWQQYTRWLQGTVNHKVCILELGVGMRFPTVIRWPFEKVAYFNQKAVFFRIHSKLYQITEEIKDRSIGIESDPIEFLSKL